MNIIELAKEAGFDWHTPSEQLIVRHSNGSYVSVEKQLERFAALARAEFAKEDLEVIENLRKETIAQCEAGMIEAYQLGRSEALEKAAKVCEGAHPQFLETHNGMSRIKPDAVLGSLVCAAAIRSLK